MAIWRRQRSSVQKQTGKNAALFLSRVSPPAARYLPGRCISRQFKPTPVGELDIPRADTALQAFNHIAGSDRKPARKHGSFTDHSTLPRVRLQADSTLNGSDTFMAK